MSAPKAAPQIARNAPETARPQPADAAPVPSVHGPYADLLDLHRIAGNQAVGRMLRSDQTAGGSVLSGQGGMPLSPGVRARMEASFGRDFSGVRVHTDAAAAKSARLLGAKSYVSGNDVVFGAGYYLPDTEPGEHLLAHELAHVIQGAGRVPSLPTIGPADDSWERDADLAANAVRQGKATHLSAGAPARIRLTRDPNLPARLQQIQDIPRVLDENSMAARILTIMQGINLADPDNLQPVIAVVGTSFPPSYLTRFLQAVDALVGQQRPASGPTPEQQARMDQQIATMQVGRRGPYGQYGPGVVLPVVANAARPLANAFVNSGAFLSGLFSGLSQNVSEEQIQQLTSRLVRSNILGPVFPAVFASGAAVGIVHDVIDSVKGIINAITNFSEMIQSIMDVISAFFSPDGEQVARAMGAEIGRSYAQQITGLLNGDIFDFTFGLGKLIGPTIVYTVLAFLGVPEMIAEAVISRLLQILRPLLQRFPRLLRLAEATAAWVTRRRGARPRVDPNVDRAVERSFDRTFTEPHTPRPIQPGEGVVAAGATQAEIAAARRVIGHEMREFPVLRQLWLDVANPGEAATLTAQNSRGLFDNHRNRFWRRVRATPEARRIFEDAGFIFPEGDTTVPIFRDFQRRHGGISLEHMERRVDNPLRALDPDNMQFLVIGDNTNIENLPRRIPSLRQ